MKWLLATGPERVGAALLALALAALSPVGWREALAAGAAALTGLLLRGRPGTRLTLGFGFAVLAAHSVAVGSEALRFFTVMLSMAAVGAMLFQPRRWPPLVLAAVGLGGMLALLLPLGLPALANAPVDRSAGLVRLPSVVATFAAVLLFFSSHVPRPAPRAVLAAILAVPALLGLTRLVRARAEVASSAQSLSLEQLGRAVTLSREAGWQAGERDASRRLARELLLAGRTREALEVLPETLAIDARAVLVRAEATRLSGQGEASVVLYRRGQELLGKAAPEVSPEGRGVLGLWEARRGETARARSNLEAAEGVGIDRYRAELAALLHAGGDTRGAQEVIARALPSRPDSPFLRCAGFELEPDPERAKACLENAPKHVGALRVLAAAGDGEAAKALQEAGPLPELDTSFDGLIALTGASLGAQRARPGETIRLELAFEVRHVPMAEEAYVVSVHFDGPSVFAADHLIPEERRSAGWVPGERFRYALEVQVPHTAMPGTYPVHLALYAPASRMKLRPSGMPGHIQFIRLATLEVSP